MKIILFIALTIQFLHGQNHKKDLFITYDSDCVTMLPNPSNNEVEVYLLNVDQDLKNEYMLSINEDGQIDKKLLVRGSSSGPQILILTFNGAFNNPINVNKDHIYNLLNCYEIVHATSPQNIFEIFDNFENIYLVKLMDKSANTYAAKKVAITQNRRL